MQSTANKTIRIKIKRIRQFIDAIEGKVNRIIKGMDTCYDKYYQSDWEYIPTALKALSKESDKLKEKADDLLKRINEAMEKNSKKLKRWKDLDVN